MKHLNAANARDIKKFRKLGMSLSNICIASALVVNSAYAELQILDDSSMSKVTGMAGLTIDIETEVHIGEHEYVDAGSIFTRDRSFTGIGGGLADNIRAKIDIAGHGERLATGFSDVAMLASHGYLDATEADVAWAINEYSDGAGGFGKEYGDGDVVIHVTSQDFGLGNKFLSPPDAADHAQNLESFKNAVDFNISEGEFGLRASDDSVETVLTKNLSIDAYLGYLDIIIKNNGNGFHDTALGHDNGKPGSIKLADSYIGIDIKFRVEDLDVDSTNNAMNTIIPRAVTTPYLTLRDMRIHNERGLDTEGSFGFASLEAKIAAAQGVITNVDNLVVENSPEFVAGHAIYDVNVKMDWDLPHISFGSDGQSIGKVFFTDFHISDTSVLISAH